MKKFVIVRENKTNQIKLMQFETFRKLPFDNFSIIDDTDSDYKAKLKLKEITAMGVERYLATRG